MNDIKKQNNHLYPAFHIRKWVDAGGQVYDKSSHRKNKCRNINYQKDFTAKFYYSLGKDDSVLEDRLSRFEYTIAPLIERIDSSEENIYLTGKELELIKLYCLLCANRHANTCEVIKSDEANIYRSNDYVFGTHRNETPKEAVDMTTMIVKEYEKLIEMPSEMNAGAQREESFFYAPVVWTAGLHLSIVRADAPVLLISDRFCILENTIDSDHLYAYIPISPKTALLLVNSEYYFNEEAFCRTKAWFGEKYGNGVPEEYLSDLFGAEVGKFEDSLFCEYYSQPTMEQHIERETNSLYVKINYLPKEIFRLFNSIYCEDGEKILFCDQEELDFALTHQLQCRDIVIG